MSVCLFSTRVIANAVVCAVGVVLDIVCLPKRTSGSTMRRCCCTRALPIAAAVVLAVIWYLMESQCSISCLP
ncbi:hypothetical protein V8D89_011870 [Ganoderma adspersum]